MLHKQKRGITCVVELKIAGEERSNQHAPITAMPNDTSDMQERCAFKRKSKLQSFLRCHCNGVLAPRCGFMLAQRN